MYGSGAHHESLGFASVGVSILDGSAGVTGLVRSNALSAPRPRPFGRPVWRGRMHSWAFAIAIPAGAVLTLGAHRTAGRVTGAVYALTLVALFGTSAAYHRLTSSERSRAIMQKLDHSMIYLLIAGTCTPLCLVVLPPAWGLPILGAVLGIAALGITLTIAAFERARHLSSALYPLMVCVALLAAPTLAKNMSGAQLAFILSGVIAYAVGLPVLMSRRPDPWPQKFGYHEIWHVLTIVAASLHFVAIRDILS